MARVKRGVTAHAKHKKILKAAKGFYGRRKKRTFRALWIQRINAAVREHGMTYGRFIEGLTKAGVEIDRKVLADIAVKDPAGFKSLVDQAAEHATVQKAAA